MVRVLMTSTSAAGHVRPMIPVARQLVDAGHEVHWYTGRFFRSLVERSGARFLPVTADLPFDVDRDVMESTDGDRKPGIIGLRNALHDLFVASIPAYVADLEPHVRELCPDVVVTDHTFMASALIARLRQIPTVAFASGPLVVSSSDTAPFGTGLAPSSSPLGRARNRLLGAIVREVVFRRSQAEARRILARMGVGAVPGFFADWNLHLADRYLQSGVPEFEYPRSDLRHRIDYLGLTDLQGVDHSWVRPPWWDDVLRARRDGVPVVVTTQGSASTSHRVLRPAVEALADRPVLHVATTVTREPDHVLAHAQRPANLRMERFIPFTELLPLADVLITNGGHGGVQTALSHGVALVVAGTTEDKMETNARVQWSGAGVFVRSNTPSARQLARAVDRVLADPSFRASAARLASAYRRGIGAPGAARIIVDTAMLGRQNRSATEPDPAG